MKTNKPLIEMGNYRIYQVTLLDTQAPYFWLEGGNREPQIFDNLDQALNLLILRSWRESKNKPLLDRLLALARQCERQAFFMQCDD